MEKEHVFYYNGKEIDVTDTKNVWFEVKDGKVYCYGFGMSTHYNKAKGQWENRQVIATKASPDLYLGTNNMDELVLRYALPNLKGARLYHEETIPNWDYDPYGNRVRRGSIVIQNWNLEECFK